VTGAGVGSGVGGPGVCVTGAGVDFGVGGPGVFVI
jgi:hypothetical protein